MARLSLEGVRKVYRSGVVAVHEVTLEVADGEFVAIVGPSGCGKSTTLALIAGLEQPTSGHIRIDGQPVEDRSPRERDIAMVFQSYALYPHMNVRRNLAFPLEVAGLAREVIAERVRETAALLGLEGLYERRPRELSGGQRQRVALGRALVRRPKVFLFDEPLSNLDAALRTEMRGEIKKLHERLAATFIYVTHDQAEAMTLSDSVVVMHEGKVQQVAPPREVYEAPANRFVAGFFGTPRINLVPPSTLGIERADGLEVGVRPEQVAIGRGGPPESALAAQVYLVEPTGAETWVTVALGQARLTARAPSDFVPRSGEAVWIQVDARHLHWFDAGTGRRVSAPPSP